MRDRVVRTAKIPKIFSDVVTENLGNDTFKQVSGLATFLEKLFPDLQVRYIDDSNRDAFNGFLSANHLNMNAQAVLCGNTVYIPRTLSDIDILLEEFLHPLIEVLYNDKREFFDAMLEEAKKDFSLLARQIDMSYSNNSGFNQTVRDKELVTQALSRYFRDDLGKRKSHHNTFKYFVNKFIRFIKDLFGIGHAPEFSKTKLGTRLIPINSLTNLYTLSDLAHALNTKGISFDVSKGLKRQVTYHLSSANFDEDKYEAERLDEHRTAIYRKQDYIIPVLVGYDETTLHDGEPIPIRLWEKWMEGVGTLPDGKGNYKSKKNTTREDWEKYYGKEDGDFLYDLNEYSISIGDTEEKYKQDRLEAIYDDREGELFPELSFFKKEELVSRKDKVQSSKVFSKELQDAISTGNWTEETKQELNDIINQIENGTLLFQRFPQKLGAKITGVLAQAETLVSGGPQSTSSEGFGDKAKLFKARQAEGKIQEQIIESWAKKEGLWLNDYTDKNAKPYASLEKVLSSEYEESYGGSEALIYQDKEHQEVVKAISLLHNDDNVQMALDRIVLHNTIFPSTSYTIIGFGRDSLGHFRIIAKQKFIQGESTEASEINGFVKNFGLEEKDGWFYTQNEMFRITDLSPLNVLKDENGELQVIDCDIELKNKETGFIQNTAKTE